MGLDWAVNAEARGGGGQLCWYGANIHCSILRGSAIQAPLLDDVVSSFCQVDIDGARTH